MEERHETTESTSETVVEKPTMPDPAAEKEVTPPQPVERTTETTHEVSSEN